MTFPASSDPTPHEAGWHARPMTEPRPRLVLLRHGETEWSRDGRHTGRTDVPLTPLGRRQATAAGPALARWAFAEVRTSPLGRARDTASLAGHPHATVDEDLLEWDYGAYEGVTTAEIRTDHPGWTVFDGDIPGGETPEQVGTRVDRVIERVRAVDGDVLLVAHAHLLRVLAARWVGLPATGARYLDLSTASISVLAHKREQPVLFSWNSTAHLAGVR